MSAATKLSILPMSTEAPPLSAPLVPAAATDWDEAISFLKEQTQLVFVDVNPRTVHCRPVLLESRDSHTETSLFVGQFFFLTPASVPSHDISISVDPPPSSNPVGGQRKVSEDVTPFAHVTEKADFSAVDSARRLKSPLWNSIGALFCSVMTAFTVSADAPTLFVWTITTPDCRFGSPNRTEFITIVLTDIGADWVELEEAS
jgi:hypothetical protein